MYDEFTDPSLSREENIVNVPPGVSCDQWASFYDIRQLPEIKELCKRNAEARRKQTIPHTCGPMSLARKIDQMELELGHQVGRGEVYVVCHKKNDGSYVNEKAKEVAEKIIEHMSQDPTNSTKLAPDDALGKVLGKEHSGRVRGLGLGACPTSAFGPNSLHFNGLVFANQNGVVSNYTLQKELVSLKSQLEASLQKQKKFENVFLQYLQKHEGTIPEEFASMLNSPV